MFASSPSSTVSPLSPLSSSSSSHHRRHLLPSSTRRRRTPNYKATPTLKISCSSDPITALTNLLWGRSLPPSLLISTARSTWHSTWHLFMRQLAPTTPSSSSYSRPPSQFPSIPSPYFTSPPLHLRLFAAYPCPWAHRTLILLALTNLEPSVRLEIVTPGLDGAWMSKDGSRLGDVYKRRKGGYEGRATVPMLWDEEREEVVCNESWEIVKFFDSVGGLDLWEEEVREEI